MSLLGWKADPASQGLLQWSQSSALSGFSVVRFAKNVPVARSSGWKAGHASLPQHNGDNCRAVVYAEQKLFLLKTLCCLQEAERNDEYPLFCGCSRLQ